MQMNFGNQWLLAGSFLSATRPKAAAAKTLLRRTAAYWSFCKFTLSAINGHSAIPQGSHLNDRLTMKPAEKPTPTTRPLLPVRLTVPYVRSSAALSSRSTVQRSNCAARLPDRTSKWFGEFAIGVLASCVHFRG
jgi:hypothetical protein